MISSSRGLPLLVSALLLALPTLALGQYCVVDVVVLNVDREVHGPISAECSRPHSIPFGNWGAEFSLFDDWRLRDGYQFSGWKVDDGWLQWNSCTAEFVDASYFNAVDADGRRFQEAMPNVVNVVESRREHNYTGEPDVPCEELLDENTIEFGSVVDGGVELKVYELDRGIPFIDGPDHVATVSYSPIAIRYMCESAWSCHGQSGWIRPASGGNRVSARLMLTVYLRMEE